MTTGLTRATTGAGRAVGRGVVGAPVAVIHGVRRAASPRGQLLLLVRCAHPKQALVIALAGGGVALGSGRPIREALVAAAALLVVQLACGLLNDVCDRQPDLRAQRSGKPVADGRVPPGNASFAFLVLLLISVPLSLQNGSTAGVALLLTYPIAFLHNRILHRTVLSWFGWAVTFALYAAFLATGGWAGVQDDVPSPTWAAVGAFALAGLCVHFLTTLPDLVDDHKAGMRNLPLVIALRTGATRLLVATGVVSLACVAVLVLVGLGPGLRH